MTLNELFLSQMSFVSMRGSFIWFGFLIVWFTSLVYFNHKKYKEVLFIAISFGSYIYSVVLKAIFQMPRPDTANIFWLKYDNYSFPSTHVVTYTVIFGFLFYLLYKHKLMDNLLNLSLRITCAYLILLVGISRVSLGQHFIRDVFFGYIFGFIYLAGLIYLYNRLRNSVSKNQ